MAMSLYTTRANGINVLLYSKLHGIFGINQFPHFLLTLGKCSAIFFCFSLLIGYEVISLLVEEPIKCNITKDHSVSPLGNATPNCPPSNS